MNSRRLYRCRHDRKLAGVASGMAEYLGLDPTVVRILWIISVFFGGFTILLYIILAFLMPLEPSWNPATAGVPGVPGEPGAGDPSTIEGDADAATAAWSAAAHAPAGPVHEHRVRGEGRFGLAMGVLLVAFGAIALIGPAFPGWVTGVALGPAFVLALGLALVVVALRGPTPES